MTEPGIGGGPNFRHHAMKERHYITPQSSDQIFPVHRRDCPYCDHKFSDYSTSRLESKIEKHIEHTHPKELNIMRKRYCSKCLKNVSKLPGIQLFHCLNCKSHSTLGPHECFYCKALGDMIEVEYTTDNSRPWEYNCTHGLRADSSGLHLVTFLKKNGQGVSFQADCKEYPRGFDDARMQGPIPKEWWK